MGTDHSGRSDAASDGRQSPQKRLCVLLADDTPGNQQVIADILQRRGHICLIAADGRRALELFRQRSAEIDVVLMDLQMPHMDGFRAAARIRELEAGSDTRVPIIALTAHALQGDRQRCLAAGMDAHIGKPVDVRKLTEAVESLGQAVTGRAESDTSAAERSETPEAAVDLPGALKRLGGDISLLKDFVRVFDEDTPLLLGALHAAVDAADVTAVRRAAHSMRGLSSNFGAAGIVAIASQLEMMSRDRELANANRLVERLENETAKVADALAAYR